MRVSRAQPLDNNLDSIRRIVNVRNLLLVMTVLQLLWLAGIWVTRATTAVHKLLPLGIYTLFVGIGVTFLPARAWETMQKVPAFVERNEKKAFIILALIVLIVGVTFTFQQRVWTHDEEGNYLAAQVVANDGLGALFENYGNRPWLGRQHPPLVPIMHGLAMKLFGVSRTTARLLTLSFALGTGWLTYLIGKELFNKITGFAAACFLFSFPLIFRLGTAAMVEVPLTFFFALTLFLTLWLIRQPGVLSLAAVGLAMSAGLLSKYTMVFILPIVFGFIAWRGSLKQALRYFGVLGVIGLMFFIGWLVFANNIDVLSGQFETISHYAGLVLTNSYGRQVLFETMTNRLPSALGVYSAPLIALGAILMLRRRQQADWLVLIWIAFVWIPLILTLPDHRYFMPSFPALALLMAEGVRQIPKALAKSVLLTMLFCGGALYLFVDWARAAELFIR